MFVHRQFIPKLSCRFMLTCMLAVGLSLGVCGSVSGQKLQPVATPTQVDVELGEIAQWIKPGTPQAENRAIAMALDLVEGGIRNRGRAAVLLHVTDYPIAFVELNPAQQAQVKAAVGSSGNHQFAYEAAIAWQLKRAIELARDSQPSTEYGITDLPLDPATVRSADSTNANYLSALNAADVIVAPFEMNRRGNRRDNTSQLHDVLTRTGIPIRNRTVLCRVDNRWQAARGLEVETRVNAPVEPPIDKPDATDPDDAVRAFFATIDRESGVSPLDQLLAAWGTGDAKWDLNRDETINVQDLLALLARWEEFQQSPGDTAPDDDDDDIAPEPGIARFAEAISIYQQGTTGNMTVVMLADAPANPNIVFQTWSVTAGALQSPLVDREPPFVYPSAALDQVTDGDGEIQAVIRNEADEVLTVVKMPVVFVTGDADDDTDDDDPWDSDDDIDDDTGDDTDDDGDNDTDDTDTTDTTDTDGGDTNNGAAPVPAISMIGGGGQAPYTVHVHALNTQLQRGDELTAMYAWDFGDPSGAYNTLVGWNAAHTYNTPGTYTITLTVTDELGIAASATTTVTVHANTRKVIYVSSAGNDSNDGSTEAKAVRTVARAVQLTANDTEIRIRRGSTYNVGSSQMLGRDNVRITSYGSGSDPTLWWTGPSSTYSAFLEMNNDSRNILIERIKFDAPTAAGKMSVRGIMPDGVNITVRNCTFGKVSDALCNERKPTGILIQDNHAGTIGAYFSWSQGSDFSIIGNTVENSAAEHNIRFGGVDRGLVYGNSLTNTFKATLWCMDGTYAYVSGNEFHDGPVTIGPNEAEGDPDARLQWAVVERNTHEGQGFRAHSGAEHVIYRNNALRYDDKSSFTIAGTNTSFGRTAKDIRIINNTATNESARGRFLEITSHADDVLIANNMYVAPNLETGSSKTANVYIIDSSMSEYTFRNNLWTTPKVVGWGDGWHYMYEYWSHRDGYLDMSEWAAKGSVHNDSSNQFAASDLQAVYDAEFEESDEVGRAQPGVHTDLNGKPRPLTGPVRAGAVEE